jgi:hypothetical protein
VDQDDVGVAAPAEFERLPRADGDDVHPTVAELLECREDRPEQARVVRARGRRQAHDTGRCGWLRHREGGEQRQ